MEIEDKENNLNVNETTFANELFSKGWLPGPLKCSLCNGINFSIQNDRNNKTSGFCFRCLNYKCKKKYNIRINSIFEKFPQQKLSLITEIIKSFYV